MKSITYPLSTKLAILQQCEYDLSLWQQWLDETRTADQIKNLASLEPEKWTLKLKLIRWTVRILGKINTNLTIKLAVNVFKILESFLVSCLIFWSSAKLNLYRRQGLKVVVIAGSYGKTSVKHWLKHQLSHQWPILTTPASYNTPLSNALTIIKKLHSHHKVLILELGEYQIGDIAGFLEWLKPDYGVLTPVGWAHGSRLGEKAIIEQALLELVGHRCSPHVVLSDVVNKSFLSQKNLIRGDQKLIWYGSNTDESEIDYQLILTKADQKGSGGKVKYPVNNKTVSKKKSSIETRLLGLAALENALPGIALTNLLKGNIDIAIKASAYIPDIERRLAVSQPGGVTLIDNSYNTNPGSWQKNYELLSQLKLNNLAVVTGGFVELAAKDNESQQILLANQLMEIASVVGVIKSRFNQPLIAELEKKKFSYLVGYSQAEVLEKLSNLNLEKPIEHLWLEGGMREMYQ